ncbi:hypothetical protein GCM10007170_28710 [Arthrobacter liuii]|uniref:Uncharacterized protein n=1 Tax=Arthrobacter liuii TaxID=1476996 RepID=A0ABQ2AXA7_9MICC|nr:hypothetical protein GCM10007170_28710 [Arthrobacter liuii]
MEACTVPRVMALTSAASSTGRREGGPAEYPAGVDGVVADGVCPSALPPFLVSAAGPSTARIGVTAVIGFPLLRMAGGLMGRPGTLDNLIGQVRCGGPSVGWDFGWACG